MGNPQRTWYTLWILKLHQVIPDGDYSELERLREVLSSSVDSLFRHIMGQQDALVQNVVETMIVLCSGDWRRQVTQRVLEMVLQQSCAGSLEVAKENRLLECIHGSYQLANQDLQETLYSQIPESKRSKLHLRFGRRLWKYSDLDLNDESMNNSDAALLPIIAQQLQRGFSLVEDAQEKRVIALIHWHVGKKAMQSSQFTQAAAHFEFAISVMNIDTAWSRDNYNISLALYNNSAEAYFCAGDYFNMERAVNTVLEQANCFRDKLPVYYTLLFGRGAQFRQHEAVAIALDLLHQLDEPMPSNPTRMQLILEIVKTLRFLRRRTVRLLTNLSPATNVDKIAAMTLLNFTFHYSIGCSPERGLVALLRLLWLTIEHGTTTLSATAFCGYGFMLAYKTGQVELGYQYGQIALSMPDQAESKAWLSRVYVFVYGGINLLLRPFRDCMEPLLLAQRSAMKTGDIEVSVLDGSFYLAVSLQAGMELTILQQCARKICLAGESYGQKHILMFNLLL
jgi:predicted ATPase